MEKPKFQNPLVSVVIPAFNEERFISKTLPRRWRNGILAGSFHHLVNALAYALFGKLIFQKLPDIRDEQPSGLRLKPRGLR